MRQIVFGLIALATLLVFGGAWKAESHAENVGGQQLEPLAVEPVGESISGADPEDVWYYFRITNPNDTAVGFRIELPERDESGNLLGARVEEPCQAYAFLDIFRQMTMVPANGSIVVFYPPILGGRQNPSEVSVRMVESCDLQGFWNYYPTSGVVVADHELRDDGYLALNIAADEELQGRVVVQVQVVLLNEAGRVVDLVYTNTDELNLLLPGEHANLIVDLGKEAAFTTYQVNILGLAHP